MKIENVSNKLMSNPLVHTILVLFIILIVLGIIRLFMPTFGLGANAGAHFGTLKGNVSLEGFYDSENFDSESNNFMNQEEPFREKFSLANQIRNCEMDRKGNIVLRCKPISKPPQASNLPTPVSNPPSVSKPPSVWSEYGEN